MLFQSLKYPSTCSGKKENATNIKNPFVKFFSPDFRVPAPVGSRNRVCITNVSNAKENIAFDVSSNQ